MDARPDVVVAEDAFVPDAFVPDAFVPDAFVPDGFALDAGDPCAVDTSPLVGPICMRALFADPPILSCPGGFVDVVARGSGTLRWQCDGRRAEAVFSDRVYRGTRTGDQFALCIESSLITRTAAVGSRSSGSLVRSPTARCR